MILPYGLWSCSLTFCQTKTKLKLTMEKFEFKAKNSKIK